MKPLIETDEDRARIVALARAWEGTPYVADGAVKGTGCSCSSLPWIVLNEYGLKVPEIPRRAGLKKVELLPTMLAWLDEHPEFFERQEIKFVEIEGTKRFDFTCFQPGDVLLLNAGIGHMLIMVDQGEAMHSMQNKGVHASNLSGQETRLVGIWRPVT